MKKRKGRRVAKESRPNASMQEVMAALLGGHIVGLLQQKRVTLAVSQDALKDARKFIAATSDEAQALVRVPDSDPRVAPLVRHIEAEQKRVVPASSMKRAERRIGQTVRYPVQRNTQRKTGWINLPVSTIDGEGKPLAQVDVTYVDKDTILVRRSDATSKESA